ncbi:MAG TPA: glycosyltransferase [Candidatus Angelobacter sp.]|nr:glycosyltransferase [Candidatus Angelobacter sp.]
MRILIATVTAGAGHLQAAAALEEAWRTLRPGDMVEKVDLLDFVSRLQRRVYIQGYVKLVKHAPELWGMVFKKTDNPALLRKVGYFRRGFAERTNKKFVKYLKAFQPDAVICTHYLPVEIMAHLERKGFNPMTVCVVTDFEAHALWMEQTVDLYCVAAEETKASLVARGARARDVVVTGIPIAGKFSNRPDSRTVRRNLGLRDDLSVVLVLGGGFGMGPMSKILAAIDKVERNFQTVVVAGRNEKLRRELACADFRHPVRVLGFVTNMHELMAVADLIVTKPGGLTTSEALAMGKPLFILNPIPGQEAANSDFLLERGAAAKANRIEDVPFRLEQLIGSKKLKEMAGAAKALGHVDAAQQICGEIFRRLNASQG